MRHRLAELVECIEIAGKRRWTQPPEAFAAACAALRADHIETQPDGGKPAANRAADSAADSTAADSAAYDAPLLTLAEVFGLRAVDLGLLVAAAAPDLEPNFGLAYALLQGTQTSSRASAGLALELCGVPLLSAPGRARLGADAPLRRHGLLEVVGDEPLTRRPLRVPDRVVAHLLGDGAVVPHVAAMRLQGIDGAAGLDVAEVETIAAAIGRGEPLSWVHSPTGACGLALAVAGFEAQKISCLAVDLRRCPATVDLDAAVRDAAREAGLARCGLVVTGAELLTSAETSWVLRSLLEAAVPVVAVADAQWRAAWLDYLPVVVTAPPSSALMREKWWRASVPDASADDPRWGDLMSLRLTPEQIAQAAAHARVAHADAGVSGLLDSARRVGAGRSAARSGKPSATFDDLVLPDSTLDSIRQLVSWARRRDGVLAANPRLLSGGKGRGVSALFAGSPGTGKTLAAHVVADALNLDLYQVELPTVVDKYIGETEKNLHRVFHEAESLNAVLFFDEADSLFGSRSEVRDARDRYANIEVAYLLQRMEQFDGIAILATNLRGNLDVAFSRRLQFIVHFPEPDEETRRRLWSRQLEGFAPLDAADPVDVERLAKAVELAGGDIRNIVMAAAYAAADDDGSIGMRHVLAAVERELRKLGRRVPAQGVGADT